MTANGAIVGRLCAMHFRNWSGTHGCSPARFVQPAVEEEVAGEVRRAAKESRRVRVVGAMHSWNDSACSDDVLLNLDRLAGVIAVEGERVTVGAGTRIHALNRLLAARGLAMANLGSIDQQSVAGAIATGTHGTGVTLGNLSSRVTGMRVVTADGKVLDIDEATDHGDDGELLRAGRVSLGALGVVTRVTLACVPAYDLVEQSYSLPLEEAVRRMDELVDAHRHLKMWWLPHTKRVQVFAMDIATTREGAIVESGLARWWDRSVILRGAFASLLWLGARWPSRIAAVNRLVAKSHFKDRRRVGRSDEILHIAMPARHRESEYAVPRARAPEALERLAAGIARERLNVNFVVELRWVRADDSLLSCSNGRDACYVGGYMREAPDRARYFAMFESLMQELDGRPHWGKEFSLAGADLRARLPGFARFAAVRKRLDPERRFDNDYLRRLFD